MPGVRGSKNPMPKKAKSGPSGVFNQQGSVKNPHADALSYAKTADRKGPAGKRDNQLKSGKGGHSTNMGLKRGTAK